MAPLTGPFGGHVDQVGIIVPDLESAAEAYSGAIGASFQVFEVDQTLGFFSGSSPQFRIRFAVGLAELLTIELIQPVSGVTLYSKFLEERGPGIHHLGIYVPDLTSASAALAGSGCQPILTGEIAALGKFAYFDCPAMHCTLEALELASTFPLFLMSHAAPLRSRSRETGA